MFEHFLYKLIMIDPDTYINEYYVMNQAALTKPMPGRYANLNFSRLLPEKKIVSVKVDILIKPGFSVREYVDWDMNDEKRMPAQYAANLIEQLRDIVEPNLIAFNKVAIRNQILDQLLEHVEKNTYFPRIKLIKKEHEAVSLSQLCPGCGTLIYNPDICVNCNFIFEKKIDKKIPVVKDPSANPSEKPEDLRQTERQRILELRQKNINVNDGAGLLYAQEGKEKKTCKKCGEVNGIIAIDCKNCKTKFPVINYYDLNLNQNYSVHFWDKINKNSTVQQLKNFQEFFSQEDFTSLKYLYEKTKMVMKNEFEDILTEDAFSDLLAFLDKQYFSFSNPTHTTDRLFESAYFTKYSRNRPRVRMLNFNNLTDVREGWLPDNLPDKNIEEKKEEKVKPTDANLKRKRGRPKKIEIFKNDIKLENEIQIALSDREDILRNDISKYNVG
jgi:hypothetical protein